MDNSLPRDSAGQIASDEGASVQNPIEPAGRVTVEGINDEQLAKRLGTTNPERELNQTQATPGININSAIPPTFQSAGAGAPRDDNVSPTTNTTQQILNANFNQVIKPQPNVLDQFASYTYGISWYLLTPLQI